MEKGDFMSNLEILLTAGAWLSVCVIVYFMGKKYNKKYSEMTPEERYQDWVDSQW